MIVDDMRKCLSDAVSADPSGLTNFVVRGPSLSEATVTRFSLVQEMAKEVTRDVVKAAADLTKKQFLSYDPSYRTDSSQVLVEALIEVPELGALDTQVRSNDVALDNGGGQTVAVVHAVGIGAQRIVAYRLKGPGIGISRKGVTLLPRDGVYRPVDRDILYYEPRFDAFTCGDHVYFTSSSLIQTKLHADGKARELARDTLAKVTATVEIDGFEPLKQAVMDDPNLRAKMAAVARLVEREPDYAAALTTAKLVEFVESNPDYGILISEQNGKKMLKFDSSPQHRHQILRLLADDYLHSFLTNRDYEAGSKQRVGG